MKCARQAQSSSGLGPTTGPKYAVRPSVRSRRLSNIRKTALEGWWMVQMTVRPAVRVRVRVGVGVRVRARVRVRVRVRPAFAASRKILTTASAMELSRPLVGSSTKRRDGS